MSDRSRPAAPADRSTSALDRARRLSVAPMIDWTDRHCRRFHRMLAPGALLYTEMITTGALLFGDQERHLAFSPEEHPVALQLGGSEPDALAASAKLGLAHGYDEINLNCGCPSPRVQKGAFGACLMREPELVADCVRAMREAVAVPVTVKHRIGVDDDEEWPTLWRFVTTVAEAGCTVFVVHARKAWLKGLSPKENREIPPLRYELVERLKAERPDLTIVLNGGLRSEDAVAEALGRFDGVMIGREAYENPWSLTRFGPLAGQDGPDGLTRQEVVRAMAAYALERQAAGTPFKSIGRHMLGLFNGLPGARRYRRLLSEGMIRGDHGPDLLEAALAAVRTDSDLDLDLDRRAA
ncbi:tRNA dihydrouridine(20/20a) synthase DusA [Geminicoccus roseus]|uniref:tRNA dihydrouridine(20/20a) synthase DusA n=1 Tax=Geminicoccus roseus TaxID=404900 RepID=UPI001F0A5893